MDFSYADSFGGRTPEAYETLILDCLLGDATLYSDSDWIEQSWALLTPILDAWQASSSGEVPSYPVGASGPEEANELLGEAWRKWAPL